MGGSRLARSGGRGGVLEVGEMRFDWKQLSTLDRVVVGGLQKVQPGVVVQASETPAAPAAVTVSKAN